LTFEPSDERIHDDGRSRQQVADRLLRRERDLRDPVGSSR